jgi:hypothetical protein
MDREWGNACGVVLAAWLVGSCLMCLFDTNHSIPKCPKCGMAWEEEGCVWPTWKHCPGCGLKMSDDTRSQEKP